MDASANHQSSPEPVAEPPAIPATLPNGELLAADAEAIEVIDNDQGGPSVEGTDELRFLREPPPLPAFLRRKAKMESASAASAGGGFDPEKVYGVTRRFSLATVMLMMAGASVILAAMNAAHVAPVLSGMLVMLCLCTAVGQMFLFGGNDPRRASIVVGAIFCSVVPVFCDVVLHESVFGSRALLIEIITAIFLGAPLGAAAGYLAGCIVAGVLLMMDLTESKLEGWRKARQPDDDPWPPPAPAPSEPALDSLRRSHPQ